MFVSHTPGGVGRLPARLGFWAACGAAATFIVFTLCFVAIPLTTPGPLFVWTNLAGYQTYIATHDQFLPNLARVMMLLFGPLWVILLSSLGELAPVERRLPARISLCFGALFAGLTGMHYFVQISAVRLSLARGETAGLEQFVQANPLSGMAAINLLGWTLFLGLASLFAAAALPLSTQRAIRLQRVIRGALVLNGIFCLLGGIGYVLDSAALVYVTLNFGMGGAVLIAVIALGRLFRTMDPDLPATGPEPALADG